MKLFELLELLNDMAIDLEGTNPEVLIATQPNWPLQARVAAVTVVGDTLYIAEGSQPYNDPYAPRAAWDGGFAEGSDDEN